MRIDVIECGQARLADGLQRTQGALRGLVVLAAVCVVAILLRFLVQALWP